MNTYGIALLSAAAAALIIFLVEKFTGVAIFARITEKMPIIQALRIMVRAVGGVYPSDYFNTAADVLDATVVAVQEAENLWLTDELPKEERLPYARNVIAKILNGAGIEITEQISDIIEGCIALTCLLMPHGRKPEAEQSE